MQFHYFYSLPVRMHYVEGNTTRIQEVISLDKIIDKYTLVNSNGRDHLGDEGARNKVALKLVLEK